MRLEYDIVDVFTDRPFAGNQLAVVHGAEKLSTAQCLALAQEFNYSETTFPVPSGPDEYTTRIFTPGGEIPFAGHPTLGTAWVLRSRGLLAEDVVTQVCGAGRIGVSFGDGGEDGGNGDMVELSASPRDRVGPLGDALAGSLLADVGLDPADLAGPVWVAGCGLSWAHVPVLPEAVGRAVPSTRPQTSYDAVECRDPWEGINLVAVSGEAPSLTVHARVFVPGLSIAEDPATGSAAAGLGVALVASGALPEGGRYEITQGVEIGRPSLLHGRVDAADGEATACHVAGQVQPVASGEIATPDSSGRLRPL